VHFFKNAPPCSRSGNNKGGILIKGGILKDPPQTAANKGGETIGFPPLN